MKLESAALTGKEVLNQNPLLHDDMLHTSNMLRAIFENRLKFSVSDLAYSAHAYLARGLAALATENAIELGVKQIGFSGGAACNQILTQVMRETVQAAGLKFLVHENVPAGDGGVSFGQAVVGGFSNF